MASNPEQKAEREKEAKRSSEMHDRYRASGLALTVLIVSLAGASINAIRPQGWLAFVLALPIALAILHQACLYMGQRHEARASWQLLSAQMQADHINSAGAGVEDRLKAMEKYYLKPMGQGMKHLGDSVNWFTWADHLCGAAVVSFILCGAVAISRLPSAIKQP